MAKKNININFKPKQVTKKLLSSLSKRGQDILVSRYGLGSETRRMTLESIGKKYKITRERVRQIENHSISSIRKSKNYKEQEVVFKELENLLNSLGGFVSEDDLLGYISNDKSIQNHIHFLFVLGESFKKLKEDERFKHRWFVDDKLAEKIHESLEKVYESLSDADIIPESKIISVFLDYIKDISEQQKNEEIVRRWFSVSKKIDKNTLGEWGRAQSPNIRAKVMKDYAYLVLRKHGSPMHFKEIAGLITEVFAKKAHVATTHNELIKDKRFVLVGRGLYALTEWGYLSGVVRDIISHFIEKQGPMTKEEIIKNVLKERYVKENTVLVNLQNPKYFKREKDGRYNIS